MNGRLFLSLTLCVGMVESVWEFGGVDVVNGTLYGDRRMAGILYKSVKRFYCSMELNVGVDPYLIVRGSQSWQFPQQDVNLTINYPKGNNEHEHVITSVEVLLYLDGNESKGYVTSGGILHDSISMTYIMPNITRVSYNFELYGIPKDAHQTYFGPTLTESNMCRRK